MKKFIPCIVIVALIVGLLPVMATPLATPVRAATTGEIDDAIQDGLAWLAARQYSDGHFGTGYYLTNTALAVLAFENEGHFPGGGTTYSNKVEKGLNYIFTRGYKQTISSQTKGYEGRDDDPDTNGNGKGVYFSYNSRMYETGIVMQTIIASNTPDRIVTTGSLAGMTYREVMEDLVDYCAWAQIDGGSGRGGWRYSPYNNSIGPGDNSVSQWPVLGLIAAEQWGIYAPQFVKDEMEYWVTYIQNPVTGASGYSTINTYPNISKTGGLLVEFYYLGYDKDTPRVKKAINYINSRWNVSPYSTWYGNLGHPYAMFSVFKGLELMKVTEIPNAPATPETPAGDWWGHYCDWLVNNQRSGGYWSGYSYWNYYLATPWYIVILQASVFPVSVDVTLPSTACTDNGYDVSIHYSVQRFLADGTVKVYRDGVLYDTITLDGFKGSTTVSYNIPSDDLGIYTWQAVMDVTSGVTTAHAEDIASGEAYLTPQVSGIPGQYAPFSTFDLDDYQTCECSNVDWTALNVPATWTVTIDADNVVSIVPPADDVTPADITFEATFHWPGQDCVDSDTATFYPNRPPVADAGKDYGNYEYYEMLEGGTVELDGSASYDPDGDELISYDWDLDEDSIFETPSPDGFATFSAEGYDASPDRIRVYVFLKVVDEHGAEGVDQARIHIYDQAPVSAFSWTIETPGMCSPVHFTDESTSVVDDIVAWEWDFAGIDTSSEQNPSYYFPGCGNYTVTLSVTDDDGSVSTSQGIVSVIDNTPPVPDIAELPDITAVCSVTVTPPTATDDCAGTVTGKTTDRVVYNRQGTYTIIWEYDDGNGNVSNQVQTVIIADTTPPVITSPADVIVDQQSAEGTVVPLNATATDNCDCDVFIASNALPVYPVGTTEITFIATDDAGNISSGSTLVTVEPLSDMKENILNELIYRAPDEFDKAIRYIENSLNPDYWNDDTHLDSQHGHKVFNEERHAVTELMKYYKCNGLESLTLKYTQGAGFAFNLGNANDILTDNGDGTYTISPGAGMDKLSSNLTIYLDTQALADIHTSCSAPIDIGYVYGDFIVVDVDRMLHAEDVSQEVRDTAYGAIERLVRIDRTLAETNIIDATNEPVLDPSNQWQVEHQLDLAHIEFAKGDERRDSGDFDHAIDHYRNAWNHACHAIEHATMGGEFELNAIISLTLSYAYGAGFDFSFDKNGDDTQSIIDNGDGTYTILPQAGEDVLPKDTTLYLDRQEVVSIHTECTSIIAIGDVYGDFTIVDFEGEATMVAPTIVSNPITTAVQEQLYTYEVQATDPDAGDVLTCSLDTAPDGMTIDPVSGVITWTPTITQTGNTPVTVRVADTYGLFDIQSFVIRVGDFSGPPEIISTPPTAATQDQPYSYDVDAIDPEEGDILTYSLDIAPVGMTIDPETGLINWTPMSTQTGSNAVIIRVTDAGGAPDIQGYTITVLAVNGSPQISSIPVTVATQNMAYSYDMQVTDPDMGDIQTYALDDSPEGMTINSFTGLIQWIPDNTQVGDISVTVEVVDTGGLSDTQSWTIAVADVSDPPQIVSTANTEATQDAAYTYDVEAADPDIGDTLDYSLDVSPAGMTIDPITGLIEWTPDSTQVGGNSVIITVVDAVGLSDVQEFSISVENVNDSPQIISTTITAAIQGAAYTYNVEAADPDPADTLTWSLDVSPAGMTIDSMTGLIEWTPASTQVGDNAVTVRVEDSGALSHTQSFTINVADVNDAPEITSAPVIGATQDVAYIYDVEAADPDIGDTLAYSLDVSPAGMTIDSSTGLIEWTPTCTQVGDNSVIITVVDAVGLSGIQEFSISVENVNDPPQIISTPIMAATQDVAYTYDVEAADPDPADTLTWSLDVSPAGMSINSSTGLIEWMPMGVHIGDNPVTVSVVDGTAFSDTQSFTITVVDNNLAPLINSTPVETATEGSLYTYIVEAVDPNAGDVLNHYLDTAPSGMTIDPATGFIQWTPTQVQVGSNAVTVRVVDQIGLTVSQQFIIAVADANDPPVITSVPVSAATQDMPYTYDAAATDPDPADTLTWSLDVAPAGMSIDSSTGLIEWTPTSTQVGDNSVTVRVADSGALSHTQSFTINVANVNDAPQITSIQVIGATQDNLYTYDVDATDPDTGDVLTYSLHTSPDSMTIDSSTGLIQWMPSNTQTGDNSVVVKVTDTAGLLDTQNFTITVANVNDAPQITSTPVTGATQDYLYTYDVNATDPDIGDVLTYSLDTCPDGMTIDSGTGLIEWIPSNTQIGANSVVVRATDTAALSDTQSFNINVADVNNAPEIISAPVTAATQDNLYTCDVDATDPDIGDVLTYSLDTSPDGMTIDSSTGLIQWIPSNTQVGENSVVVRVTDTAGFPDTQSFTINVANVNDAPEIISDPGTGATKGCLYTYDVDATDPDIGDVLTYSLDTYPDGMTIDSGTGLVEWTPASAHVGSNAVIVSVQDLGGLNDTQSFTINVTDVNDAPVVTSTPMMGAVQGVLYVYDVEATDSDGDALTYTLNVSPSGMTIDSVSGLINWTPTSAQLGNNDVEVRVDDGRGCVILQAFTVKVSEPGLDYIRPIVDITIEPAVVLPGMPVTITVHASDNIGVDSSSLTVNGDTVPLDSSGMVNYSSTVPGVCMVEATALDAAGNEGYASGNFSVIVLDDDTTYPMVGIESPEDDATVSVPTEITGTVDDDNLVHWALQYSIRDMDDYTTIAEGNSYVTCGVLGTFDTTILENGYYDVKLMARDARGNITSVKKTYRVEGDMKVGNFTISYNDLTVPMSGIDMTVTRTYDSRDKTKGDFGIGWTLGIADIQISESGVMGEDWGQISESGGGMIPITAYAIWETKSHIVTVSYPDGRVDEFHMVIDPYTSYMLPVQWVDVSFEAEPGTLSTLEALTNNYVYVDGMSPATLLDMDTFTIYDPDRYRLTTRDGTIYIINQDTGVESIQDTNGNTVTIGSDGIIHSAGASVTFNRDAEGRITSVTDPVGNTIEYEYDAYGDLVSVTDQEGYQTAFIYNHRHGLLDILDPRGIKPVRNEYADDGKLIAHIDADGNRIEYEHNTDTRQEIITDRLGNMTVMEYDDDGNVVQITDALGKHTYATYDGRGNKLSDTNALGYTTTYTYDESDNLLTETDPLGNVTAFTWNERGQMLTRTDPNGDVTTGEYDVAGNLTKVIDPLGNETVFAYDAAGNLISAEDPLGNVTLYAYNGKGNLVSKNDPLGNVTTYTYDANGNRLSQTNTCTTPSGPETITTTYEYDGLNRLVQTTDPYGYTTITEYDAVGQVTAVTDKLGNRTESVYDDRGNLERVIYPDGTEQSYTYDVENRRLTATDRAGRTTEFEYDNIGRQILITYPDGTSKETTYDAIGQVVQFTGCSSCGIDAGYTYDAAGRNTEVTDALGYTTFYGYDANGNMTGMTDARGNTTGYVYDDNGRQTEIIFANGSSASTEYDALGRIISETDQAGKVTRYEYDALGQLTKVIDALCNETVYTYDEAGNRVSQTDANGHTTGFEYDKLGRMIKRTLPLGMSETITYDAEGNVISQTDFNGDTITFDYDENNRLISKSFPDGTSESYTYTDAGMRESVTDSQGATSYEYDQRDRLIRQINPGGEEISYTYCNRGNRTSITVPSGTTTYTYDANERLLTVTDPDGGITTYTYDAVGNRASVNYPNGTVAEYTYDSLNRLTGLVNRKSTGEIISSYVYTLGTAGNRIQVTEYSGRVVNYTYDVIYRLEQETVDDPVSGLKTVSYTYDPVGNRLTKTDDGVTTGYTYDDNDRLLTEDGTTYSWDNNGNLLGKVNTDESTSYRYDFQNRLVEANTTDTSGSSVVEYAYDTDGIRVQMVTDGTVLISYLVDKNRPYAQVLEERDVVGTLDVSYIYGDDLISQDRSGVDSYYYYDGQMSVRALTDAAEAVTDTYTYDAFGNLLDQTGVTVNNYLYTGEQYDPNIGFYYLRARYYNTGTGRFITQDPWQGSAFDPPSLHRYLYAGANPVDNWDPSGQYTTSDLAVATNMLGQMAGRAIIALRPFMSFLTAEATLRERLIGYGIVGVASVYTLAEWIEDNESAEVTETEEWIDKEIHEHCLALKLLCDAQHWITVGTCQDCYWNCRAQQEWNFKLCHPKGMKL